MSASSTNLKTAELVSVNENVSQVVLQNELQKLVAGAGDCPAILLMVIDNQTMSFGSIPELAVVVGIASAAILNTIHMVVVVHHLMQQGGCYFLNRK